MEPDTALVIGGAGAVGTLFCKLLLKYYHRIVVIDLDCGEDSQIEGVEYFQGDINDLKATDLLKQAKLILMAIPEEPAIRSIGTLGKLLQPGQCLIDTMSVKSIIVENLYRLKPAFEAISINPLFGPSLGFQNQAVACVEVKAGPLTEQFLSMMRDAGAKLIPFTAEEHDRYAATIQAATHAAILSFGLTLDKLNYASDLAKPAWTPPHKALLTLLARILVSDPEVYRDIQASNPFAEEAREALRDSVIELNTYVLSGSPEKFRQLFERLKLVLGTNETELAEHSQKIFKHVL